MKVKQADDREIPRVTLKQTSVERQGEPFLSRTEQQNVRGGELGFNKISNFEDSIVSVFSIAQATLTSTFFNALITAAPRDKIKVLTEVSIYIDTDADSNYLWPTGALLTSSQKNLIMTVLPQIVGSTVAPNQEGGVSASSANAGRTLGLNEQRIGFNLRNQSADTHTYYCYLRFIIIKL